MGNLLASNQEDYGHDNANTQHEAQADHAHSLGHGHVIGTQVVSDADGGGFQRPHVDGCQSKARGGGKERVDDLLPRSLAKRINHPTPTNESSKQAQAQARALVHPMPMPMHTIHHTSNSQRATHYSGLMFLMWWQVRLCDGHTLSWKRATQSPTWDKFVCV